MALLQHTYLLKAMILPANVLNHVPIALCNAPALSIKSQIKGVFWAFMFKTLALTQHTFLNGSMVKTLGHWTRVEVNQVKLWLGFGYETWMVFLSIHKRANHLQFVLGQNCMTPSLGKEKAWGMICEIFIASTFHIKPLIAVSGRHMLKTTEKEEEKTPPCFFSLN